MKLFQPQQLANLIYDAGERTGQTTRTIAGRMGGIDPKYLARQINPNDAAAKMGVEDFVYFLAVTDLDPLDYIEELFDRVAVPIPHSPADNKKWLCHISEITRQASEAVAQLATTIDAKGDMHVEDCPDCRRETYEALQALAALWAKLKGSDQ